MNGVRSTFMRRGYLLTALSALLLLAASAGTASAQSVEFGATSGEVLEGSGGDNLTATSPRAYTVTVTRSPRPPRPIPDNVGPISLVANPASFGTGVTIQQVPTAGFGDPVDLVDNVIAFDAASNHATLVVTKAEDDNWASESLTLSLRANAGTSIGPDLMLTMVDNEAQPIADFDPNPVMLHEGSETDVLLTVDVPMGTRTTTRPTTALNALSSSGDELVLSVSPAGAIGTAADQCGARNTPSVVAWSQQVAFHRDGISTTANIGAMHPGAAAGADDTDVTPITLNACADMKGFQDKSITLAVIGTTNSGRRGLTIRTAQGALIGTIGTGSPLVINIDSDEEVPTLSFSPTDVEIAEGESTMTRLIAEGKYGAEVGMVKLMVEGDAMVDLYQDGEMLEEMGGYVMVDLGDSNTAELMAMSMESRELQDGDMAYKAWKLVEGETDGADIGEGYWFRVDVVGSTAVPALPLIGQLLLALFLMAGGSRLYRRRRG